MKQDATSPTPENFPLTKLNVDPHNEFLPGSQTIWIGPTNLGKTRFLFPFTHNGTIVVCTDT